MCGKYGLGGGPANYEERYGLSILDERTPDAAIADWVRDWAGTATTTRHRKDGRVNLSPIILEHGGQRLARPAWWWLWVGGKPATFTAFNSRDDALLKSNVWRPLFEGHRALAPADWYEEGGRRFHVEPDAALAAVYNIQRRDDGTTLGTYSLITRAAAGACLDIKETERGDKRMPLMLPRSTWAEWLDPERTGDEELLATALAASEPLSQGVEVVG